MVADRDLDPVGPGPSDRGPERNKFHRVSSSIFLFRSYWGPALRHRGTYNVSRGCIVNFTGGLIIGTGHAQGT